MSASVGAGGAALVGSFETMGGVSFGVEVGFAARAGIEGGSALILGDESRFVFDFDLEGEGFWIDIGAEIWFWGSTLVVFDRFVIDSTRNTVWSFDNLTHCFSSSLKVHSPGSFGRESGLPSIESDDSSVC